LRKWNNKTKITNEEEQDSDNLTTESPKKRDREVEENGMIKSKDWTAIVAGICGFGAFLTLLLVYFF